MNFIIFCGHKNSKIEVKEIQILQSHYPPSVNVQMILLKFKMATTSRLFNIFNLIYSEILSLFCLSLCPI